MKKIILFTLLNLFFFNAFSKKDINAWKTEKTLENQFQAFKNNANSWDGYFMSKEPQLNEFHKTIMDSVTLLENNISTSRNELISTKKEVTTLKQQLQNNNTKLEESLKKENELTSLGIDFDKNSFSSILYTILTLTLVIALVGFFLFYRSNVVTKETEKRFEELSEEFKTYKEKSMERDTKLRRELQTERNKNYAS